MNSDVIGKLVSATPECVMVPTIAGIEQMKQIVTVCINHIEEREREEIEVDELGIGNSYVFGPRYDNKCTIIYRIILTLSLKMNLSYL